MKVCKLCRLEKEEDAFYKRSDRTNSRNPYCKSCWKTISQAKYVATKELVYQKLGNRCCHCSVTDRNVFQVHHIFGQKDPRYLNLSARHTSFWRFVLKHPDWFQLLCANCHAIETKKALRKWNLLAQPVAIQLGLKKMFSSLDANSTIGTTMDGLLSRLAVGTAGLSTTPDNLLKVRDQCWTLSIN